MSGSLPFEVWMKFKVPGDKATVHVAHIGRYASVEKAAKAARERHRRVAADFPASRVCYVVTDDRGRTRRRLLLPVRRAAKQPVPVA